MPRAILSVVTEEASSRGKQTAALAVALAVLYFATARLGLSLAFLVPQVTLVWPPTGISLAAVVLFGPRVWPGIAVGAFLANLLADETVPMAAAIAFGNTLEALIGAWLLRRFGPFDARLERTRDVLLLALLGAGLSTTSSATIGMISLCAFGAVPWSSFLTVWPVWWLGDAVGDLVVAPLVLTMFRPSWPALGPWRRVERLLFFASLSAVSVAVFITGGAWTANHQLQYLVFPFLIWAGLRLRQREVALAIVVASAMAIGGALRGAGPFAVGLPHHRLWLLQTFMSVAALTGLTLGAVTSERRRFEEDRRRLLATERAARGEAEEANRIKDDFLAVLSHELRTPLNAILGWVQILRHGQTDEALAERALETIERNTRLQTRLVSDILDVSRITSGALRLDSRPVDLGPVIDEAAASVRLAAQARRVTLEVDATSATVRGDAGRLRQVVLNLLSNAVKFAHEGGRVEVRLARKGDHAELSVLDDGPGIAPEFVPHLFERFSQADVSTTRRHGGLGLGLAIAHHLVERHGGTLEGGNRTDVASGAVFTVRVPLDAAGATPAAKTPTPPVAMPLEGVRVLALDDDRDARDLMQAALGSLGARVATAGSAGEALEMLRRERPDVLLVDVAMPGEDGYAFIRRVRALSAEEGGRVPAAAVTAYASEQDRERALSAGFQSHVTKPVEPAELARIVLELRQAG